MEEDLAEEMGVTLGDRITWDVQGVPVYSVITSLRAVNWARFEPNFFVVFAPGALERAPHSLVTLARVPDAAARGRTPRLSLLPLYAPPSPESISVSVLCLRKQQKKYVHTNIYRMHIHVLRHDIPVTQANTT